MKIRVISFVVLFSISLIFLSAPVFSEEPHVYTDSDLKGNYGGSSSSGVSSCKVVNYDTYSETTKRPDMVVGNAYSYGNSSSVSGVVLPGSSNKTTFMTITIQNTSKKTVTIRPSDITVHTVKGNAVKPSGEGFTQIDPGQSKTISVLKFKNGISQVADIDCYCP